MFKKKKTYIDKINFDVFEDEPSDFDLFSKENFDDDNDSEYEDSLAENVSEYEERAEDNDIREDETVSNTDTDDKKTTETVEAFRKEKVEDTKSEDKDKADDTESKEEADDIEAKGKEEVEDTELGGAEAEESAIVDYEDIDEKEIDIDDEDIKEVEDEDLEDSDIEKSSDDKNSFSYDDFDKIGAEMEKDLKRKERTKKGKGKIIGFTLLWFLVFGAGVVTFLYFKTDVFKKKEKNVATSTDAATTVETTEATETTEELDEDFYTIYSYQTNADVNINALMADYYDALVKGDKDRLKDIVTEPEAFGDMMIYETKAQVISEYSNITCYTIPGLHEDEILVFTTSNVTITGVESKPLDIKQFYVVKDGNNYKINNGVLSQEIIDYINVQAGSPDVQDLYKSVQDNINKCLAEDSTFADFYNKISTNTDADEETEDNEETN